MGGRLARSLVEYYVALRISASAATAYWPLTQPQREPQPIVRVAQAASATGFDPRESFRAADGGLCVITLPQRQALDASASLSMSSSTATRTFSPN